MEYCQHYKNGHIYKILHVALHSETHEEMVVYQGIYDSEEFGHNPIFVRPKAQFFEEVEYKGAKIPRFQDIQKIL